MNDTLVPFLAGRSCSTVPGTYWGYQGSSYMYVGLSTTRLGTMIQQSNRPTYIPLYLIDYMLALPMIPTFLVNKTQSSSITGTGMHVITGIFRRMIRHPTT